MKYVVKCKGCDRGPCYLQSPNIMLSDASGYGDSCVNLPTDCPYGYPDADFELCGFKVNANDCEKFNELLGDTLWDNCPEEIRDQVYCFGIDHPRVNMTNVKHAFRVLVEQNRHMFEYDEFEKEIKKLTKLEIATAVLEEAFRAGIAWREWYLQTYKK